MHKTIKGGMILGLSIASATLFAQEAPSIIRWSPRSGPVGTKVILKGTNMAQVTEVDFFNGKKGLNLIKSSSSITVTVPVGTITGPIKLITPANGSVSTSTDFTLTGPSDPSFIDPPHIPLPSGAMTGHPRIFLTATDVPKYQAWANTGNPLWNSLRAAALTGKQRMDQHLVPDQDEGDGSGNYSPYPTEQYAELFAFMSLVDPNAANRADYAKRAHDLIMYEFNIAAQGAGPAGTPFRMPQWSIYNRSRWFGEAFPCVVDWCYQTFSPAEKATVRKVFLRWIQENLVANVTSEEHPTPLGLINDPALTTDQERVRWAANNYYCNHARQIGLMAMALDAADDVPTPTSDKPAGTCRDFIGNAIGAWLYQVDKAEKTAIVGGMSPEGLGYGESDQSAIAMLLLGMNTSGVDRSNPFGPQAEMASDQFWSHDILDSYIHSMSPAKVTQFDWIGPSNLPADYADVQSYAIGNYIRVWGPIALMARARGDQETYDKVRWMIDQYEPGSKHSRDYQLRGCLDNYGALLPIFYFMACDPAEPAKADPRPAMPTEFISPGLGRLLSRTSWDPSASWMTFKCSWETTDHNPGDANKIEFYRKGEWLTKGRQGYGFNVNAVDLQNTMSIENPTTSDNWFWVDEASHGGQFPYGTAGDPSVMSSVGAGYVSIVGDATNLYNLPSGNATDVLKAERSVLWLKPDFMVIYDRTQTGSENRYKRFYLNTENLATVNGKVAKATTPKGQSLYVTSVFPANATISAESVPSSETGPDHNETVENEFMLNRIKIEDPAKPKACHFLNVLQGANSGASATAVTGFHQSSGELLDGCYFAKTAVAFCQVIKNDIVATTFTVPNSMSAVYVGGLKPGNGITVTTKIVGGARQITLTQGGTSIVDGSGMLKI